MKVRDRFATINGSDKTTEMPSGGLEIISDDGKTLFHISLKDNVLDIAAGSVCRHGDKILDDKFVIAPRAANRIQIIVQEYKGDI